jgi:SAM-dependent methyltransferase
MTDASEWRGRTGEGWAAEWRRTDRSFGPLTERLLARTREFACREALDIGCGAGELSLALARGRPHCRVVGIDISPPLIAVARERAVNRANVSFEVADAAEWRPDGFAPDFVTSRHGVMFFDDPASAFTHLEAIAVPGAGLMFSCFRAPGENPVFTEVGALVPQAEPPADPHGPGPFAFADRARVEAILGEAGWSGIAFEPFDFAMVVGAGEDPIEDAVAYFSTIGPAARAMSVMSTEGRERFCERVRELARRNLREGIVALRAGAWIVTARKG